MKLTKVCSGQNGVDQAALRAAKKLLIPTGGWMPNGWITLDGPRPEFEELYGMKECCVPGYRARTQANVVDSDATLIYASNFKSPGEICTFRAIKKFNKPYFKIEAGDFPFDECLAWLARIEGNTELPLPFRVAASRFIPVASLVPKN